MKQSILFIIIYGAGLGHLTRSLAVAKRIRNLQPEYEVFFWTTSLAKDLISDYGFLSYYTPDREQMSEHVLLRDWESNIQKQLNDIMELHHPLAVVFDGAYPSTAFLSPLMNQHNTKKIWIKREGDRVNMLAFNVYEKYFDLILVPKEAGLEYSENSPHKQYCSPIMLIDKSEAYSRQQVRDKFHLSEEDHLWYIQLGNEQMYEQDKMISMIIRHILESNHNVILLGESILRPYNYFQHDRVIIIRDYPNSIYFNGTDYAISAAGYNTFHELLAFQVPSIFIPNKRVMKDDQVARAKRAYDLGVGIMVNHLCEINDAITRLTNTYEELSNNYKNVVFDNGALEAAKKILLFLGGCRSREK